MGASVLKRIKQMGATVLLGVLALYALVCVLLSSGCVANRLMFHPPAATYGWKSPGVVKLDTPTGPVAALWLENTASDKVLVYFHGNAEDLGHGYPVYVAPAPVYVAPRPIYYQPPPPVYYAPPRPVYYAPPGYYAQPPGHYYRDRGHRHGHRDHGGRGGRGDRWDR